MEKQSDRYRQTHGHTQRQTQKDRNTHIIWLQHTCDLPHFVAIVIIKALIKFECGCALLSTSQSSLRIKPSLSHTWASGLILSPCLLCRNRKGRLCVCAQHLHRSQITNTYRNMSASGSAVTFLSYFWFQRNVFGSWYFGENSVPGMMHHSPTGQRIATERNHQRRYQDHKSKSEYNKITRSKRGNYKIMKRKTDSGKSMISSTQSSQNGPRTCDHVYSH